MGDTLYVVVPCYNEQEVLRETAKRLREKFQSLIAAKKISPQSRIVFVNDGSKDSTWEIIRELHSRDKIFSGINLSRNRGHQNALLAGLLTVKNFADAVISMDADLQDDINAVDEMIARYKDGFDIVYGVRSSRATDTFFKRFTAESFYKLMKFLGADTVYNHADYRLMSRRALDGLEKFGEVNLFLRGLVPMIGYPSTKVFYERAERFAGESKYPLKKMMFFALQGITSLTVEPIRMITTVGVAMSSISLLVILWTLYEYFFGDTVRGWTSMLASLWFIGGLILLSIGIVGEYVGKIYLETKNRPRFIVSEFLNQVNREIG